MAEYGLRRHLPEALFQAKRPEKLITLILLFALMTAAAGGVNSVLVGSEWAAMWSAILLGLLAGWLQALFKQSPWRATWVSIGSALIFTLLFVAGLIRQLSAVAAAIIPLGWRLFVSRTMTIADWQALSRQTLDFVNATGVIIERVRGWVQAITIGQPAFDPVAAMLIWSLMAWLVAAWAGWQVEARRRTLLAILPAILLSVGSLSYARQSSILLYLILGTSLLLLATVQHDQHEQAWDETGTAYPKWKGRQIGWAATILTLGLVLLAASLPGLSISRITNWISAHNRPVQPQENGLAKSLGIIQAVTATPDSFGKLRQPGLPRGLLIGSGPELSQEVVMSVEVDNLPDLAQGRQPVPFYWRSFTYDLYTGHGWQTSGTVETPIQANQPLQTENLPGHTLIRQTVRPVESLAGTLYAAGEPITVNQAGLAAWRSSGDLFGIQLTGLEAYQAGSLLPVTDESRLRGAGQSYPDWVRRRYLALPAEVPGRVKTLAIELTAAEPTPYDRAKAIEQYLRKFPYTLDVPRPPVDRDLVDYFLYDLQRGYCDYYATAMVVLARAAGVPARLAIGYANGTFNLNSRRFIVTQADAHSWVEIYFPEIGWVPFEPTAARSTFERTTQPTAKLETHGPIPPPSQTTRSSRSGARPLSWLLPLAGIGVAAFLGATWLALQELRLQRLPESKSVVEVYRRMQIFARRLAVVAEPGDTPYEFAARLNSRLNQLVKQAPRRKINPYLSKEIDTMTHRIVLASYRPAYQKQSLDPSLFQMWLGLRWHLLIFWFQERINSIFARTSLAEAGEAGLSDEVIKRRDG